MLIVNCYHRRWEKEPIAAYAFIRGGNWNNTSNAGAFALNLNNTPGNQNNNIGFRCASDTSVTCGTPK